MNLRKIGRLLKETFKEWQRDKASRIAAALAYYTVFSISSSHGLIAKLVLENLLSLIGTLTGSMKF